MLFSGRVDRLMRFCVTTRVADPPSTTTRAMSSSSPRRPMRRRRLSGRPTPERTIPSAWSPSWTRATRMASANQEVLEEAGSDYVPAPARRSWSTRVGSASAPTRTRPCSGSPRKASPRLSPRTGSPVAPGTDECAVQQLRHRGERLGPPVRRHLRTKGGGGAREARRRARADASGSSFVSTWTPARTSPPARATVSAPPASATARRRAAHPSQRRVLPSKQPRRRRAVRVPEATRRAGTPSPRPVGGSVPRVTRSPLAALTKTP